MFSADVPGAWGFDLYFELSRMRLTSMHTFGTALRLFVSFGQESTFTKFEWFFVYHCLICSDEKMI